VAALLGYEMSFSWLISPSSGRNSHAQTLISGDSGGPNVYTTAHAYHYWRTYNRFNSALKLFAQLDQGDRAARLVYLAKAPQLQHLLRTSLSKSEWIRLKNKKDKDK
jgi:hypothetical protein